MKNRFTNAILATLIALPLSFAYAEDGGGAGKGKGGAQPEGGKGRSSEGGRPQGRRPQGGGFQLPDFVDIDTNKSGDVSLDEWTAFQVNSIKERAARSFELISGDDDKITPEELKKMSQRRGESRSGKSRPGSDFGNVRPGSNGRDMLTLRHGMDKSPEVGELAPDFTLKLLNSNETVTLSKAYRIKPIVLTLGSYTCPPFRNAIEVINDLSQQYNDEYAFYFVYIKEAHATNERPSRGNEQMGIEFTQPITYKEREHIAVTCQQQIKLTMPILVDTLDNAVEKLYAGAPNRTYIIDQNGVVLYKGDRGAHGTEPEEIVKVLQKISAN